MKKLLPTHHHTPSLPLSTPLTNQASPTPSSSSQATENTLVGKTYKFPNYNSVTIEGVISEGGFGIVYLCKDNKSKVHHAFKRIIVNNKEDLAVAMGEVALLSQLTALSSPHLLPLFDHQVNKLNEDITEIISLTPFCKNNLLQLLNKNYANNKTPLKYKEEVLKVIGDVVKGVKALHTVTPPIIHRDLKVENVLELNGNWLLCDFGSATTTMQDPAIQDPRLIQEEIERYTTLAYRAPEMVDLYSNRGAIGLKSDVWAVGIMLYKICFFTTPFPTQLAILQSHKKLDFPSNSWPDNLLTLIQWCLMAEQEKRPGIGMVEEALSLLFTEEEEEPCRSDYFDKLRQTLKESFEISKGNNVTSNSGANNNKTSGSVVVLETSVTPRQRPKATNSASFSQQQQIQPPPKSPKIEKRLINPDEKRVFEVPSTSSSSSSWNPFETDTFNPISLTAETTPVEQPQRSVERGSGEGDEDEEDEADVFAKAPFDYFKYRPILNNNYVKKKSHRNDEDDGTN